MNPNKVRSPCWDLIDERWPVYCSSFKGVLTISLFCPISGYGDVMMCMYGGIHRSYGGVASLERYSGYTSWQLFWCIAVDVRQSGIIRVLKKPAALM
jgi:hypothetical protein